MNFVSDLIANCGGLLGLYIGFSFLSLIELIYFFTVRMSCNYKKILKSKNTTAPAMNLGYDENLEYY